MSTVIHQRVEQARSSAHPSLVARVASGWVVMGDTQVLSGYCLLLPDPVVPTVNDLSHEGRKQFLLDMTGVGDALLRVTDAVRINYSMLGNLEPALHAHIVPRYADEPEALRTKPVWMYDWRAARAFDADGDATLRTRIRAALLDLGLALV